MTSLDRKGYKSNSGALLHTEELKNYLQVFTKKHLHTLESVWLPFHPGGRTTQFP